MTSPYSTSSVFTVTPPADYRISALLDGEKWDSPTGFSALLSYSFPWATSKSATFSGYYGPDDYSQLNEPAATEHYGLSSTEQSAFRAALATWSAVANVSFVQVSDTSSNVGDIRIAWTSASDTTSSGGASWGWAYFPDSYYPSGGDIWISSELTDTDWSAGSYNFQALVHEIGHTLGLKHTFEGTTVLPDSQDTRAYSVMSYTDVPNNLFVQVGHDAQGAYWDAWYVEPDGPMLYDIAAMQYLYGANKTYQTGDNTYSFDPHTPFYHTIWDAGGNDTISVSNFSLGCTIDLQQGHFSKISILSDSTAGYNWINTPPTGTYDGTNALAIAYGCVIENAIGGTGDDTLIGNEVANRLSGGAGNDILQGGAAGDTLTGGAGADLFRYLAASDSSQAAMDVIADFAAGDTLQLSGIAGIAGIVKSYAGSLGSEIAAILADSQISNEIVFFTDGVNGYEYVKGAGSGTSYDGLLIELAGKTSAPGLNQLAGINEASTNNALPTGHLSIAGTATSGHVLAAVSTLADADGMGTLSYQWYANGAVIDGASTSTLTLTDAQLGKAITLSASYVDGHGALEAATSSATAVVAKAANIGSSLGVAGSAIAGHSMTAAVVDADGLGTVSYLWQASTDGKTWSTLAATGNTLTVGAAQDGAQIRVSASFIDGHGNAEHPVCIVGPNTGSTLTGTAGNDTINGGSANDSISGGAGDDVLNGGAGIDTAVYAGARSHYVISQIASGFSIFDTTGSDGVDALVGVERVQFGDTSIALDISGNGGKVYRLYQAAFDRTPDLGGLGYWMNAMDKGATLAELANNFVSSSEFKTDYGSNPSNADILTKFYENVLHRAPDAGGYAYWLNILDSHLATPEQILPDFSESAENQAALIGLIGNGFAYTPYHG